MDEWRFRARYDWIESNGVIEIGPPVAALRNTLGSLSLVAEIDEFKEAWRATGRIALDRPSNLRRVATIEGTGSSTRIDGAMVSDLDVERLPSNLQIGSFAHMTSKRSLAARM